MKRTIVRLIDDIDGSDAEETVPFALDGMGYSIDLSGPHAAKLRAALAPYMAAGVKVGAGRVTPTVRRPGAPGNLHDEARNRTKEENRRIRAWAQSRGIEIADRGAIKFEIVTMYKADQEAAHNRAAVKSNGAVTGDKDQGLFLAASDAPAVAPTGILRNVEPKRTEIPPAKAATKAATTNKVVTKAAPAAKRTPRRRANAA